MNRLFWQVRFLPVLAATLFGATALADNGMGAPPPLVGQPTAEELVAEGQRLVELLAPIGTFRVADASRDQYLLKYFDEQGHDAGSLILRTGMPMRQTRYRSQRFAMEIWNRSPEPVVVDRLVQAAKTVAAWDGGGGSHTETTIGPESSEVMVQIATLAVLLAIGMGIIRKGRISFDFRLPHVLQVIAQGSIFLYWALYWPAVIEHAPTMMVHLVLAYAADAFFCLARFRSWRIGLSPVPVVFSINLFEWFDWRAAFVGIVVAFGAKVYLHRKGRHIFNPSVIGLTVVGIISIIVPDFVHFASAFHTLNIPPNMAEVVLLAAMLPQLRYRIVPISIGALLALESTGNPALVRPAIILAFTLLASDPATTPQTDFGKFLFGGVVGFGLPLFSVVMRKIGQPDDFAKVMCVAVGNLAAPGLDAIAGWLLASATRFRSRLFAQISAASATWGRRLASLAGMLPQPLPNRAMVGAWLALCLVILVSEKPRDFEPALHWNWATPMVALDDQGVPTCEANPVFCRPFSFIGEAKLWIDHAVN